MRASVIEARGRLLLVGVDDSKENGVSLTNVCAGLPFLELGHIEQSTLPMVEFDDAVAAYTQ